MDRRAVLRGGVAGASSVALGALLGCAPAPGPVDPGTLGLFDCGVASGLHSHDASVLWTRFAPASTEAVELEWQVAADPTFGQLVATGSVMATPASDGCAKVLVSGLPSGSTLWYRFLVSGEVSPVGRTRVLPAPGDAATSVRLAVASCQNYSAGYFSAWRAIAAEDVDVVVHLGDYIYESGGSAGLFGVRDDTVGTADDLASYRAKYRLYRSDPDLRAAHAAHAFVPVWDDHEFVNDWNRETLLEQPERAAAAFRVWFEYQPVWRIDGDRIHRRLRWGSLLDLALIDTRQFRDPQVLGADGRRAFVGSTVDPPLRAVHAPDRTILGAAQRDWLIDGFGAAQLDGMRWKLVANQVMISPIRPVDLDEPAIRALVPALPKHAGVYVNFDDWDGYQAERDLLTTRLADDGITNVGFLTGDIHSFWQSSVLADFDAPSSPAVAQEFVCGSISSRGVDYVGELAGELGRTVQGFRPGFRYTDFERRGYGLVECTPSAASVEYRTVDALSRSAAAATARRRVRFDWPVDSHELSVTRP